MSKRTCYLCGDSYHYCPNCDEDRDKPLWMFTFCSTNCHNIYETLVDQTMGHLTVVETKEALDRLNVEREKYDKNIQDHIDRVTAAYSKVHTKIVPKIKVSKQDVVNEKAIQNDEITN